MTKIGLKVAQPGRNAKTGLDSEQIFSTEFPAMATYNIFTIDYTLAAHTTSTKTIKHGLTFVPYVLLFYKTQDFPSQWTWFPNEGNVMFFSGDTLNILDFRIDKENIVLRIDNSSASNKTISIKLYIFTFPIALSI